MGEGVVGDEALKLAGPGAPFAANVDAVKEDLLHAQRASKRVMYRDW